MLFVVFLKDRQQLMAKIRWRLYVVKRLLKKQENVSCASATGISSTLQQMACYA